MFKNLIKNLINLDSILHQKYGSFLIDRLSFVRNEGNLDQWSMKTEISNNVFRDILNCTRNVDSIFIRKLVDSGLISIDDFINNSDSKLMSGKERRFWKRRIFSRLFLLSDKIDLSPLTLSTLFGIISSLFLISGFLHNFFYLSHFGINVSYYFTIFDHLSTSSDKFLIPILSIIASLFLVIVHKYKEKERKIMIEDSCSRYGKKIYKRIIVRLVIYLLLCILSIIAIKYLMEISYVYAFFIFAIIFIFIGLWFYFPYGKLFTKPVFVSFIFETLIFYIFMIFSLIYIHISKIDKYPISIWKNTYTFSYIDGMKFNDDSWIPLMGNSGYFFFFDKNKNRSYIIPQRFIKSIEIKN